VNDDDIPPLLCSEVARQVKVAPAVPDCVVRDACFDECRCYEVGKWIKMSPARDAGAQSRVFAASCPGLVGGGLAQAL